MRVHRMSTRQALVSLGCRSPWLDQSGQTRQSLSRSLASAITLCAGALAIAEWIEIGYVINESYTCIVTKSDHIIQLKLVILSKFH